MKKLTKLNVQVVIHIVIKSNQNYPIQSPVDFSQSSLHNLGECVNDDKDKYLKPSVIIVHCSAIADWVCPSSICHCCSKIDYNFVYINIQCKSRR